jgi:hypothetical protein
MFLLIHKNVNFLTIYIEYLLKIIRRLSSQVKGYT